MSKIRIIICDDHPVITQGLRNFLDQKKNMQVVATASTGTELMKLFPHQAADILLLDINLPDISGITLCADIKKEFPDLKIIGFSNNNERSFIVRMLSNNASGYLVKSASVTEIEQAIEQVYQGGIYFGNDAQKALASLAMDTSQEIPPITKREREVLQLLAKGLSSVEIADKIFVTSQTVDSHRKNLLAKFSVNKTVSLLQKAKEMGLLEE